MIKLFFQTLGILLAISLTFSIFVFIVMLPAFFWDGPVSFWQGWAIVCWVFFCFSVASAAIYTGAEHFDHHWL